MRWTCKSVRKLADALRKKGHRNSCRMVARVLNELGYSLQAKSRKRGGLPHTVSTRWAATWGGSAWAWIITRLRIWKVELRKPPNETKLRVAVCHFPPGTGKWNKIEHRLFSFISQNWRGKPLVSHEVIVNLIANTTTSKGLKVQSELDPGAYPAGIKVSDQALARRIFPRRMCGSAPVTI